MKPNFLLLFTALVILIRPAVGQTNICSGATSLTVNPSTCNNTNWTILKNTHTWSGNTPTSNCSNNNYTEDIWYSFTATSTNTTVEVANNNRKMAFAVYQGPCGSLTEVACQDAINGQGTESATFTTVVSTVYYVQIIHTNGWGNTATQQTGTICVYDAPTPVVNSCLALGFDDVSHNFTGNHSLWSVFRGKNNVSNPFIVDPTIASTSINDNLFSSYADLAPGNNPGESWDYFVDAGLSVPIPNGSNNVMRLGAYQEGFSEAHGMVATFTVTESYLRFYYLLAFEETGNSHAINDKGFCTFIVKDASNNTLPCSFSIYEDDPSESWTWDNTINPVYLMTNWESVTLDVSGYMGQSLTIEVWTADCTEGAHSGYGYFDFECFSTPAAACNTVLPVDLYDFKSECINNQAVLTWTTTSEINSDYFTVWHSTDGVDFKVVDKIPAAGFSQNSITYTLNVNDVIIGETNYFRLSQSDYNGVTKNFKMIAFEDCANDNTKIYTDMNNSIHVVGNNISTVKIYDITGKLIQDERNSEAHHIINTPEYSSSMYVVQVIYNNQTSIVEKILIK